MVQHCAIQFKIDEISSRWLLPNLYGHKNLIEIKRQNRRQKRRVDLPRTIISVRDYIG
jgi:hypothetical protein